MGSFKEIGNLLKDAKAVVKDIKQKTDDARGQSIAKQSSATTMQFPVIVSRSINVDTSSSVVKALERQYAIFVQMVISLNPVMDWDEDDIPSYVKRLHQNNPTPIDLIESCMNVYSNEEYGLAMITSINNGSSTAVRRANMEQMFCIEDHLNQNKLNDLYKPKEITMSMAESSLEYFCKKNDLLLEARKRPRIRSTNADPQRDEKDEQFRQTQFNYNRDKDEADSEFKERQYEDDKKYKDVKFKFEKDKYEEDKKYRDKKDKMEQELQKARFKHDIDKANAENRSKSIVKLSDNDVKKCNELVPTTLSVSLQQIKGNNFGSVINFVLGIKGIMHPVNSNDMVSNLVDGYKAGNKFFNFLRWTSGEIAFFKDLLFNVDNIKEDAIRKHNKGSHWWTTLKRNRSMAKIKNVFSKNKILPNATIVCSMEEIMEIKDVYNIDLMVPKNVNKLMDRYFLLGFVIVDESQELSYFMFDGERDFQALSFNGLERENNNKNDFKDIYKMINSGRL